MNGRYYSAARDDALDALTAIGLVMVTTVLIGIAVWRRKVVRHGE